MWLSVYCSASHSIHFSLFLYIAGHGGNVHGFTDCNKNMGTHRLWCSHSYPLSKSSQFTFMISIHLWVFTMSLSQASTITTLQYSHLWQKILIPTDCGALTSIHFHDFLDGPCLLQGTTQPVYPQIMVPFILLTLAFTFTIPWYSHSSLDALQYRCWQIGISSLLHSQAWAFTVSPILFYSH